MLFVLCFCTSSENGLSNICFYRHPVSLHTGNGIVGIGGAGKSCCFQLDENLQGGSSAPSDVFDCPLLSFTDNFISADVELWLFIQAGSQLI
jgi:hypothetical protein